MNVELTKDEAAIILDGLAALPLARSYNIFNKLYVLVNAPPQIEKPTETPAVEGSPTVN